MIALQQQQPFINNKALAWTIGVHCLLFLFFILLTHSTTYPPPPAEIVGGLEVNLGTTETGSGKDQPMNTKAPAPYQATVVYKNSPVKSSLPKNIVQSTQADAPEVNDNNKNKKNNAAVVPDPTHTQEKPKTAKYTYAGETGAGGNNADQNKNGKNEGNDHGPGDKGKPGGTPGAPNYDGPGGNGNGNIHHTISGRSISPDKFEAEFSESGTVVIQVGVDRSGNIVSKTLINSPSSQLTRIAYEKLRVVKFSPSAGPDPIQYGKITLVFKTH
jgi:outer membrane biosynthesis protein TonB